MISSPSLWNNKIERLLEIVRDKQLSGLSVIVITSHPDASLYESSDKRMQMMEMMERKRREMEMMERERAERWKNSTHTCPYGCERQIPNKYNGCRELLEVYPNYFG